MPEFEPGKWYPINTAPKPTTRENMVSVLVSDLDDVKKAGHHWAGNTTVAELWPLDKNKKFCSWVSYRKGLDTHDIAFMPTHWSPIPKLSSE